MSQQPSFKDLTDAQALRAWQTHNPFKRAPPTLIKRVERIERSTNLHRLGEAVF